MNARDAMSPHGEAQALRAAFEHLPWIVIIQPYEDYGLQKYVGWTPNPNQAFEIRPFNFKFKRA